MRCLGTDQQSEGNALQECAVAYERGRCGISVLCAQVDARSGTRVSECVYVRLWPLQCSTVPMWSDRTSAFSG